MSNNTSISALIKLIDDPDDGIFSHVRREILNFGPDAIPLLESSWEEDDYGLLFQTRIEEIIHDIQFQATKDDIKDWIESDEKNLLQGVFLVAKYQFPELDLTEIKEEIQNIRKDIWLEINSSQTIFEQMKAFNEVFFRIHGFQGNTKNYHSPLNSYLNVVLETRKGNPLTLSVLYSIIAQSLDLPVFGVNLPNHFVLAYVDKNKNYLNLGDEDDNSGVLFYINAFSKGAAFNKKEIHQFLKKLNIEEKREYFEPCPNTTIIKRMLTNLIVGYQQQGNSDKVKDLSELKNLFDN